MLKISLDESYVFDLLSIFKIKILASSGEKNDQLKQSYNKLENEIIQQIGGDLFKKVIHSNEYDLLTKANQLVFNLVDRANESELSKETAEANYERYLRKVDIQKHFFTSQITEIKL